MKFKFNVNLTDEDYLNFNMFVSTKTGTGKRYIIFLRTLITVVFVATILIWLFNNGFDMLHLIALIPCVGVFALLQLALMPQLRLMTKRQINLMKKDGKSAYSPFAEMEFYDDYFIEITEDKKSEIKYTSIEKISVLGDKVLYLHVSNSSAYIIPISTFISKETFDLFMEFIKTKCSRIDTY